MKNALYFMVGAALGSAVTYFVTRKSIWDKCDKELEDMKRYYEKKKDEVTDMAYLQEKKEVDPKVKEALLKNWNKPDIFLMHDEREPRTEEDLAESEHPTDSDEDPDDPEDDISDEEMGPIEKAEIDADEHSAEYDAFYRKHKNDAPRFVNEEELAAIPASFETDEWTYFAEDDTMINDDDAVVEDYRRFIGNILDASGWIDDMDADDVSILSYEFMTVYKITKIYSAYEKLSESKYGEILNKYK